MIQKHIFRAYDIRGIVGKDFTKKDAFKIGKGFATFFKNKYKNAQKIAVGRDGRLHSKEIQQNFIQGVLDCGLSVCDIGLSSSPLLNFSVIYGKFDGGVNITASHNPKEFNGFKLQGKSSHAIFGEEIKTISKIIEKKEFTFSAKKGVLEKKSFVKNWLEKLSSLVCIKGNPLIAIDCGNGVCGQFAEKFFQNINCRTIGLFCEVDGNFPHHEANPEEAENLQELKKTVLEKKCTLGIAFDGDGDRVGLIDKNGKIWPADLLLLLLAKDLLSRNPKSKIVHNLTATQILKTEIEKLGGKAIICKTGHSFIEKKMIQEKALLGGETSGHLFFAENYFGFDDAFLAAAKLIEIAQKSDFLSYLENLPPTFATKEIKIGISEKEKFSTLKKIVTFFKTKFPGKTLEIDGIRINFTSTSWGVVRASNTSPFLTARFEALSKKELEKIKQEIFTHLREYETIDKNCLK